MRSVGRESGLGRLEPNSACARSSPHSDTLYRQTGDHAKAQEL